MEDIEIGIQAGDDQPPIAPLEVAALEEKLSRSTERLETDVSMMLTRMHRFPRDLRGIGGSEERYVVPSVVAIGPYHRHLPHLQEMEEVKQAAASRFCEGSGRSVEDVYKKILSIAGDAHRCYLYGDASEDMNANDFAQMMFVDGCFLLWYLADLKDPLLMGCTRSSEPSSLRDVFLLENLIPWMVLEALMEFTDKDVRRDVAVLGGMPFFPVKEKRRLQMQQVMIPSDYKPPHLLGLLRFILICSMPPQMRKSELNVIHLSSMSIGAVELAQIGVKLTPSKAEWFADMNCKKKLVFGELSLSPLSLDDVTACWLVNMAALEAARASTEATVESDGYVVSSYLSMLAMLMDREKDVHEIRRRGVLRSSFSDPQTLDFFKSQHLRPGYNYYTALGEIEAYMRCRPIRNAVHKFVYNNYKVIAAVLTIVSVIASILKALYSPKSR